MESIYSHFNDQYFLSKYGIKDTHRRVFFYGIIINDGVMWRGPTWSGLTVTTPYCYHVDYFPKTAYPKMIYSSYTMVLFQWSHFFLINEWLNCKYFTAKNGTGDSFQKLSPSSNTHCLLTETLHPSMIICYMLLYSLLNNVLFVHH